MASSDVPACAFSILFTSSSIGTMETAACGSGSEMNFKLFRGFYSCWCKIGGGPGIVWFQVQMPVWEDMAYAIHGGSKDRGYVWPSS